VNRLSLPQIAGGILIVVAIAAVAAGLFVLGSPGEERVRRMDERRVQDLASIAQAIDVYWTRHARLPASVEELRQEPVGDVRYNDPDTNKAYEYRSLEADRYELCAEFARDSRASDRSAAGFWSHRAGRQCFRQEAHKVR
jgi:type II secretory pathway pseudopilin PulG